MEKNIVIIGAGAAGIGMGVVLKELGIDDFVILEKDKIGSSFRKWPEETRLITPSFTSNGFGMTDLNAVSVRTAPSHNIGREHLSGREYATYLDQVVETYNLPIQTNTSVESIEKNGEGYRLKTSQDVIDANFVIMAVGEFNFPDKDIITGPQEIGIHYGEVKSWSSIEGQEQVVLGANESGMDAAMNLALLGKKVTVYSQEAGMSIEDVDPSICLSTFTRERFLFSENTELFKKNINIVEGIRVSEVKKSEQGYVMTTENGDILKSANPPILCTGFKPGAKILADAYFTYNENDDIALNDYDESTIADNIFMVGPSVRHDKTVFCYIYKFRQRFAVIAETIAKRSHQSIREDVLDYYKKQSFYRSVADDSRVISDRKSMSL